MKTLTIHEKINIRSNTKRFQREVRRDGVIAFIHLYNMASCNKEWLGDYNGANWTQPTHRIWNEQEKHLEPRYN